MSDSFQKDFIRPAETGIVSSWKLMLGQWSKKDSERMSVATVVTVCVWVWLCVQWMKWNKSFSISSELFKNVMKM